MFNPVRLNISENCRAATELRTWQGEVPG